MSVRGAAPWIPLLCGAVVVGFLAHALHYAFIQDDAYIFLRYARHVALGLGPVWNPGERVEGYTSPGWMWLLAGVYRLADAPESVIELVTLALGVATLVLVGGLAAWRVRVPLAAPVAMALLAADRNFAVWSTSGMETRLYGFATLAVSALVWRGGGRDGASGGTLLAAALLLLGFARPEGAALALLAAVLVLAAPERRTRSRIAAVAVFVAAQAAYLAWRLAYYGAPLPNTFYAKVGGLDPAAGSAYLADFARSYPVFVAALVLALVSAVLRDRRQGPASFSLHTALLVVSVVVYLLWIGGDFMEFRMLDVLLPHAYLLVTAELFFLAGRSPGTGRRMLPVALAAILVASSLFAGARFERTPHRVMTRSLMFESTTLRWIAVGRWLGEVALPGESLATTAAGAIPYFSRLRSIDMLGLNDAAVARLPAQGGVGHRKLAPDAYLEAEGVTYVLGHPRIRRQPDTAGLAPGEFLLEMRWPGAPAPRYLIVRTTGDRKALVASLARRGVASVLPDAQASP